MVGFQCILPRGAAIIGWIDFDLSMEVSESRFALVITRSGRIFASKHDEIKAVPPDLWPYIRMQIGGPRRAAERTEPPEGATLAQGAAPSEARG